MITELKRKASSTKAEQICKPRGWMRSAENKVEWGEERSMPQETPKRKARWGKGKLHGASVPRDRKTIR